MVARVIISKTYTLVVEFSLAKPFIVNAVVPAFKSIVVFLPLNKVIAFWDRNLAFWLVGSFQLE
jgi:hypothetical protein